MIPTPYMFTGTRENAEHVKGHYRGGYTVIEMDTDKIRFKGYAWKDLNAQTKSEFETLFIVEYPNDRLKFIYA